MARPCYVPRNGGRASTGIASWHWRRRPTHLLAFYKLQGFRVVAEMQKPGKHYHSTVLSKTVSHSARCGGYHSGEGRAAWFGNLARS